MAAPATRSEVGRVAGRLVPAQAVPALVERTYESTRMAGMFDQSTTIRVAGVEVTRQLYWVSPDMTDLCFDAARALDEIHWGTMVEPADMGIAVFAHPVNLNILMPDASGLEVEQVVSIRMLMWLSSAEAVDFYTFGEDRTRHLFAVGEGRAFRDRPTYPPGTQAGHLLASLWLLMDQPGVATQGTYQPPAPPPVRTRGRTKRTAKPPSVRVVSLRSGTEHATAYDHAAGRTVEWRHRWMVRGHWRKQPYPSLGEGVTKRVWIAPYLKGPEGAPVLSSPKVIAVKGTPPR